MSQFFRGSSGGGSIGNVIGTPPSTDNALARYDGATGLIIQNSGAILTDANALSGLTQLDVDNVRVDGNTLSSTDLNGDLIFSPNGSGGVVAVTDLTVGNSTQDTSFTINGSAISATISAEGRNASDLGGVISHRHSSTPGFGGHSVGLRSRGTHAAPTVVSDNDTLSLIAAAGFDGTDYALAAQITIQVDGTPGSDDMPGRIIMSTSADGAQTPIEGIRLDSSQVVTLANALPVGSGGTGSTSFTAGSVIFSNGTILTEDNANLFYDDTNNRLGIGTTTPLDTFHVVGAMELDHTATEDDDHAIEIVCDANGFADVKAIDVDYITGALGAAQDEEAILVNIDESASTGGIMAGYLCLTTAEGGATINGYETGINVNPIVHQSGTFGDADSVLNKAVDVTAALASGGAGAISIFVADNDTLTIGDAAQWGEHEIILSTGASGGGVAPTFEYSTGGAAFSAFSPADGTNGFKNSGVILWDASALAGWATATSGLYEVRITRTRNSVSTTPIIDELQISALTEFKWDKDGDVNLNSLTLVTPLTETSGGTDQSTYAKGDILYASAADTLAKLPIGADGEVLKVATDIPAWGASPGGSGIVYLATATAAASAALEFKAPGAVIDATYNTYLFIYDLIAPASDGTIFVMRTSTDGGVSYSSTALDYQSSLSDNGGAGATTTTEMSVSPSVGNGAQETMSGQTIMVNPSSAAYTSTYTIGGSRSPNPGLGLLTSYHGTGMRHAAADVDAVQFLFKSGNVATGTIKMYGMTTPT